jgi:hypothetical protein
MPRDLTKSDTNELEVDDRLSGSKLMLYYRMPTTSERVQYQRKLIKRERNKIKDNSYETRLEYGALILTGFRKGDFIVEGKTISSDPQDLDYYPTWKTLLNDTAADLLVALAFAVFESVSTGSGVEFEEEEEGKGEPPLASS